MSLKIIAQPKAYEKFCKIGWERDGGEQKKSAEH